MGIGHAPLFLITPTVPLREKNLEWKESMSKYIFCKCKSNSIYSYQNLLFVCQQNFLLHPSKIYPLSIKQGGEKKKSIFKTQKKFVEIVEK